MQVSPCGHQSLCRLCFVHNIREAVANRDLPLRCLICNAKIARVKNNRSGNGSGPEHPVHIRGQTTKQLSPPSSLKGNLKLCIYVITVSGKYRHTFLVIYVQFIFIHCRKQHT